jgi:hypothetical protein
MHESVLVNELRLENEAEAMEVTSMLKLSQSGVG